MPLSATGSNISLRQPHTGDGVKLGTGNWCWGISLGIATKWSSCLCFCLLVSCPSAFGLLLDFLVYIIYIYVRCSLYFHSSYPIRSLSARSLSLRFSTAGCVTEAAGNRSELLGFSLTPILKIIKKELGKTKPQLCDSCPAWR